MGCTIDSHKIRSDLLEAGLAHSADYCDFFKCGDCGEIILIIWKGVHFIPKLFVKNKHKGRMGNGNEM